MLKSCAAGLGRGGLGLARGRGGRSPIAAAWLSSPAIGGPWWPNCSLWRSAMPLPPLLPGGWSWLERSLNPAMLAAAGSDPHRTKKRSTTAWPRPAEPPPSLDQLSFRLIAAGRPAAALKLLEPA